MEGPKKVVTHSGSFHADDVFAVATLHLAFPSGLEVMRTRNQEDFEHADILVDIGGVYDPMLGRFDHHQEGGAGARPNTIPYASFGLIWKAFGLRLCEDNVGAFEALDRRLVAPIDAIDNGVALTNNLHKDVYPYTIHDVLTSFYGGHDATGEDIDASFETAVLFAQNLMEREIKKALEYQTLQEVVEGYYQNAQDKQIIVFEGKYPWGEVLVSHPEPLFAVYPDGSSGKWVAKGVPTETHSFERRKFFPQAWAGKEGKELQRISGVEDAVFCHNGRFIAVAGSKEGALGLARKALEGS